MTPRTLIYSCPDYPGLTITAIQVPDKSWRYWKVRGGNRTEIMESEVNSTLLYWGEVKVDNATDTTEGAS
jgi:hypothetical protein